MALPGVQKYLADKAVIALNENLGLQASIDKIRIGFPNRIYVKDAFLADDHEDTLFYVQDLKAEISGFNADKNTLRTSFVELKNGRIYMTKWPEDSAFNFQLFLDKLKPKERKPRSENPFKWKAAYVDVSEMRYIKNRVNCIDSCTNISITDGNIHVKDFYLNDGYVSGDITSFTFKEKDRTNLHSFKAKVAYQEKYIKADSLHFITDNSEFKGNVRLSYSNPLALSDFTNEVDIQSEIVNARMSSQEFIEWLDIFPDFGNFTLAANSSGTVNELKCTGIDLTLGEGTSFYGDVSLDGTTNVEELNINAGISFLKTNAKDLNTYIYPLIGSTMSDEVRALNNIEIEGRYQGGIADLLAQGAIRTDLGDIDIDVHLVNINEPKRIKYRGDLELKEFNIGTLFNIEGISTTSLKGSINGTGLVRELIEFEASMDIDYLTHTAYTVNDVRVEGKTSKSLFSGSLNVNDQNIDLSFDGTIDFKKDTADLDFKSIVREVNLYALGIGKDTISVASTEVDIDVDYYDDKWFEGYVNLYNSTYENSDLFYFFDSVIVSSNVSNGDKKLEINSQLFRGEIIGDYRVSDITPALKTMTSQVFHLYKYKPQHELNLNFDYRIKFNNTELLSAILIPNLHIEPGTEISGKLKFPESSYSLTLNSPQINYNQLHFFDIDVSFTGDSIEDELRSRLGRLEVNDLQIDSAKVAMRRVKDSVAYRISTIVKDSIDTHAMMRGYALEKSDSTYLIHVDRSSFNLGLVNFDLHGRNNIVLSKKRIEIDAIGFESEHGNLFVNGVLSRNDFDLLRIKPINLNLALANYFIGKKSKELNGIMNGDIMINSGFNKPKVISVVNIDSLSYNNEWIGNVTSSSDWLIEKGEFVFDSYIERKGLKSLEFDGVLLPDSNNYLKASFKLDRFRANTLNAFTVGILSNIRGMLTGRVDLTGHLENLKMDGSIELNKLALSIPYLNSDFNLEGKPKVIINENEISINRTTLRDTKKATSGEVYGKVTHNFFKNVAFDIHVEANELFAMDLQKEDNEYFYGTGYASGNLAVLGPIDDLDLELNLTTEKGTDFKIPVYSPKEIEQNKFITFYGEHNKFKDLLKEAKEEINLRGLGIKINVKVTPEAQVELIMDETVGDVIRATGSGDLRMEMTPTGEFTMFGDYEIDRGNYLFTMRNLINKPFEMQSGGTLSWQGNPYEANIDVTAVYRTRTDLKGVVTNPDYKDQKVRVELYLKLLGNLMNPNIAFEIKLPGSSPSWQEELDNRFTNVDELNQQAFSLLVLNTFYDPAKFQDDEGNSTVVQQGVSTNTMQMALSQMGNIISSGTDFVDVNMSYSQGTEGYRDEIEFELSKTFYDDRIMVNGILDVPVGSATGTSSGTNTSSQTFTGDIEILYKITEDGRIQGKFFNRSNQNNPARDQLAAYTQGIGVLYRKDFETWNDFFRLLFGSGKKEKDVTVEED